MSAAIHPTKNDNVSFAVGKSPKEHPAILKIYNLSLVILVSVGLILVTHGLPLFLLASLGALSFFAITSLFFKILNLYFPKDNLPIDKSGFNNWTGKNYDLTLRELYKTKNLSKNPGQLLPVEDKDLQTLGLDLDETYIDTERKQKPTYVLRNVILEIINEINEAIKKNSKEDSLSKQRYIKIALLNDQSPLHKYYIYGLGEKKFTPAGNDPNLWFPRIFDAFVQKGWIYGYLFNNTRDIYVQA